MQTINIEHVSLHGSHVTIHILSGSPDRLPNDYARVQVPAVISCNQGDAYLATMELVEARFCTATTGRTDSRVNIMRHTDRRTSVESQVVMIGPGAVECITRYKNAMIVKSGDYLWPAIGRIGQDSWGWEIDLEFVIIDIEYVDRNVLEGVGADKS